MDLQKKYRSISKVNAHYNLVVKQIKLYQEPELDGDGRPITKQLTEEEIIKYVKYKVILLETLLVGKKQERKQ